MIQDAIFAPASVKIIFRGSEQTTMIGLWSLLAASKMCLLILDYQILLHLLWFSELGNHVKFQFSVVKAYLSDVLYDIPVSTAETLYLSVKNLIYDPSDQNESHVRNSE